MWPVLAPYPPSRRRCPRPTKPNDPSNNRFRERRRVHASERNASAAQGRTGLGRAGTLVGLYLMKHYGFTARQVRCCPAALRQSPQPPPHDRPLVTRGPRLVMFCLSILLACSRFHRSLARQLPKSFLVQHSEAGP
jgi:hypothetical protein